MNALTEWLMLCLVTTSNWIVARTSQMQLQMPCLVIFRKSLTKDLWGLMFSSLTFLSLAFTLLGLTLQVSFSFFRLSTHFFDPDPTAPDPCLCTCLVPVISVVRRILKRASWRTYKANVGGTKLRLQRL